MEKQLGQIINKSIETLAVKAQNSSKEDQALKYSQAALNLAHTFATLKQPLIN